MDQGKEKKSYKDTLNLPKTSFAMKAELPRREPETLKKWEADGLYKKILSLRKTSGKTFVLHDGPPYANGHIHVGHVLNKILKDITVKYFTMKGCYSNFVPGWDCHGLPVEHQLLKELGIEKTEISQVDFRKKAYNYAMKFVRIQAEEFKRLGVFADWENPYLTLSRGYEADILSALADLYEKGYIYRGLKPVNWCKTCETALAEAEVEYEDKVSPSVYVKFRSKEDTAGKKTFFIVWTTTPWTLLANVAIAIHPDFSYSLVETGGETWIMLESLAGVIMDKLGIKLYKTGPKMSGREVVSKFKTAVHPFIERDSVLVLADYVTKDEGTGCVHTAPGHGQDDYVTGKKYNLPVLMPVDNKGRFTKEGAPFTGEDVFESNKGIIDLMKQNGSLLLSEDIKHSYPHCWRCKNPVIFRATEQWFLNVDHANLREKMVREAVEKVEWIPSAGAERISAMLRTRPDWCLSRQRYWGVPIPALKCTSCGVSFTNAAIIKKTADLAKTEGADAWFKRTIEELTPSGTKCPKCGSGGLKKEEDILDVWFDSGVSYRAVLEARSDLAFPADLYLEGSDQHRGWFQAALITSMGIKGRSPYKKVLTHGFVVDGEGKKMSKSLGNVIRPEEVLKEYGADILRLWVAASDYDVDIKLSPEILARLADGYRKIRNTFRYLLSNLYDFDPAKNSVEYSRMPEIDRWMLSRLAGLVKEITSFYDSWEFHRVYHAVYDFCVGELSSFYLDVLKDTMYVSAANSLERRSAQTVMFSVQSALVRMIAPIMVFTCDEAWGHMVHEGKVPSVHMADWPIVSGEALLKEDKKLDEKWKRLIAVVEAVMGSLEKKREVAVIGSSLEARVGLHTSDKELKDLLNANIDLLPLLLRVSQVKVEDKIWPDMDKAEALGLNIRIEKAHGNKCQRCWTYGEKVGINNTYPDLCPRCQDIIVKVGKES